MATFTKIPVKKTIGANRAAFAPSGTFTKLSTGEIIRPSSVGGTAGTVSAVPASVSAVERATRTLEANARKGASASNTAAAAKPPDYRRAAELARAGLELERQAAQEAARRSGYAKGQWGREAASRPAIQPEAVDYRRAAEVNRLGREAAQLEAQRRQAAVDLDMEAMARAGDALKRIRAAQGRQTVGDRASDTLSAAVQGYGGAMVNAAGTAVRALAQDPEHNRRQIAALQKKLEAGGYYDGKRFVKYTEGQMQSLRDSVRKLADEAWKWEHGQGFASKAQDLADRMQADSALSIQRAKEGAGALGGLAVDVGIAGAQMGMDALAAALTGGSALIPLAVRSFGGGAQEARQSGASLDRQLLYGAGSAALSVGTEKLSNLAKPFQKLYGSGAAEKIAGSLAKRFGENGAVQLMQKLSGTAAGRAALSAIGEGGEEVVEALLQPFLKRAVYDPDARFDAGEAANDFLVGAILGGIGGGVEVIGGIGRSQAGTDAGVDMDTARLESAAQGIRDRAGTVRETQIQADKKAAPEAGAAVNENGLTALTALERENLSSGKKNRVITTFSEAVHFIRNALTNKQSVDRAYLGKVPDAVAQMVLEQTGVDISGYQAMMLSDSVRHMFKNHGDPATETARGQIPLTPETAAKIPDILAHPDKVSLSPQKNARGLPVLLFEKMIDGYYTTAQAVADGTHSIQADTLYIRKKAPQGAVSNTGKPASPVHNVQNVLPQEPFGGTDSLISSITHRSGAVNQETDPLIQAILDSLKPAEAGRPLDVLEQEVRRLYGPEGAALPEAGSDALIQALLGSGKPAEAGRPLDVLEQEVQRLYGPEGTSLPGVGDDTRMQAGLDSGTASPGTLEPDAFLLGFMDDGGTGTGWQGKPVQIGAVEFSDRKAVLVQIDAAQAETAALDYEVNCTVTADGKVWRVEGEAGEVHPENIPGSLAGSYSYHNHPAAKTWFSFSAEDVRFFFESGEAYAKASDYLYEYVMERTPDTLAVSPELVYHRFKEIENTAVAQMKWDGLIDPDMDGFHETMKILSQELKFFYERKKSE